MNNPENFITDNKNNTNIEEAYILSETNYSHDELSNMLQNGNIAQKQIAALKFDSVYNINDAQLLINNLTGCDGKIREAIAYKINMIIENNIDSREIFAEISAETFAKATIDINANICRLIVNCAQLLKPYNNFSQKYSSAILNYTKEALDELDRFIFRDKKYVINKQLFKLYWCLEALSYFYQYINYDTMLNLLSKCAEQEEYTIREKCAQIIVKSDKFEIIKSKLQNDENYYVKQIIKSSTLL